MVCPRCQQANPPGANFCARCGQPFAPSGPPSPAPVAASDPRKIWLAVGGTALLAILAFVGLTAAGILRLGGNANSGEALKAPAQTPNVVLKKDDASGPPVLEKEAERETPLSMPPDVAEWLRHLEATEKAKNELTLRQVADMKVFQQMFSALGPAMGELNPYDQTGDEGTPPSEVAKGKFDNLVPDWQRLVQFYTSKQPPEELRPLADDYYRALNEIPGMIGDINGVLNQVGQDPSAALQSLSEMKRKSYEGIDRYLQQADERLDAICRKYNTTKWFNIRADVAGTGMLGKMGF